MENTDVANRIMKIIFHATSTINYITTLDLNIKKKFEAREFLKDWKIYLFIPLFYYQTHLLPTKLIYSLILYNNKRIGKFSQKPNCEKFFVYIIIWVVNITIA